MSKKLTAAALAALMLLGMTGCSSGNNMVRDANRFFDTETDHADHYGTGDNTEDRYREMVENGRVHDTDGYLLDGENRHD